MVLKRLQPWGAGEPFQAEIHGSFGLGTCIKDASCFFNTALKSRNMPWISCYIVSLSLYIYISSNFQLSFWITLKPDKGGWSHTKMHLQKAIKTKTAEGSVGHLPTETTKRSWCFYVPIHGFWLLRIHTSSPTLVKSESFESSWTYPRSVSTTLHNKYEQQWKKNYHFLHEFPLLKKIGSKSAHCCFLNHLVVG